MLTYINNKGNVNQVKDIKKMYIFTILIKNIISISYHFQLSNSQQFFNQNCRNIDIDIDLQIKIYGFKDVLTILHVSNNTKIQQIREHLAEKYKLDKKNLQLYNGNEELKGEYSLADLGIFNDEAIVIKYVKLSGFVSRYISNQSIIKVNQQQGNLLSYLYESSQYSKLLTYNTQTKLTYYQQIVSISPRFQDKFSQIQLQNPKVVINCTDDMYFYTGSSWKSCSSHSHINDKLEIGDNVFISNKKLAKISNIYYITAQQPMQLMDIEVKNNQPIFINDILVQKAFSFLVLYKTQDQYLVTSFELDRQKDIFYLKKQINKKWKINIQKQLLYYKNKLLKDETILTQLYDKNIIIVLYTQKIKIQSKIKQEKMINIKFENVIKHVSYDKHHKTPIHSIIQQLFHSKFIYNKIYGLMYNRQTIPNNTKLQDVINVDDRFYYEDHTIIVVRCIEKFIIKQLFKIRDQVKTQKKFMDSFWKLFSKQNDQERLMSQYRKIMGENKNQMINFLQGLRQLNIKNILSHNLCKFFVDFIDLFKKTKFSQHFRDKCYKFLHKSIPQFYKKGDILISRDFMSCTINHNEMIALVNSQKKPHTIVTILSVSGKKMYPNANNQIIFLPFTYFTINKIEQGQNVTEIQLAEMPSPICFDRNIIVWVDDKPANNMYYLNNYPNPHKIEVLELISTQMALTWFNQFSILVNCQGIKMKVVSDLVRKQINLMTDKQQWRYQAGVDLAELLFNKKGLTTPIFIFSKQVQKGRQLIQKRQISKNRICKVSKYLNQLLEYITFK